MILLLYLKKYFNNFSWHNLLDKNSSIGIAMWTVSDILDKLKRTLETSLLIVSRISRVQVIRAVTHILAHVVFNPSYKRNIFELIFTWYSNVCNNNRQSAYFETLYKSLLSGQIEMRMIRCARCKYGKKFFTKICISKLRWYVG